MQERHKRFIAKTVAVYGLSFMAPFVGMDVASYLFDKPIDLLYITVGSLFTAGGMTFIALLHELRIWGEYRG